MGEGAKAGIAIHKSLRTYPKSLSELSDDLDTGVDRSSAASADD